MPHWTLYCLLLNSDYRIDRFHRHAVKKLIENHSVDKSQEIVILLKLNKGYTSPSFRSVRSPKPQIFVEMFRRNLQSSVWKRHVGAQVCTNMAAGNRVNIWNLLWLSWGLTICT